MKRLIKYLVLILLIIPISINALSFDPDKTPDNPQEEIINIMKNIKNIVLTEDITVISTSVSDKELTLYLDEQGLINRYGTSENSVVKIPYKFNNNEFIFDGGKGTFKIAETASLDNIETHEYSYYLYSLLFNLAKIEYNTTNYFSSEILEKLLNNIDKEELLKHLNSDKLITIIDENNTFGIDILLESLEDNKISFTYNYKYLMTSNNRLVLEEKKESQSQYKNIETNPSTGRMDLFVTITLFITIGLFLFTCNNKEEKSL